MPSERSIRIDRGQVFDRPIAALKCDACGYFFAEEGERAEAVRRLKEDRD